MRSQAETGLKELYFRCPHCSEPIRFSVEARDYSKIGIVIEEEDDLFDEEDWDEEDHWDDDHSDYRLLSREYHKTEDMMTRVISLNRFDEALPLIRENLEQLAECFTGCNEPSLLYFRVLSQGGRVFALKRQSEDLERMRDVVANTLALGLHTETVNEYFDDLKMFDDIRSVVRHNPGCVQSEVKNLLNVVDWRRVTTLIEWLERNGELVRTRQGRKVLLYLA